MCNKDIERAVTAIRNEIQNLRSSYTDRQTKFIYEASVRAIIVDLELAESLLYELKIARAEKRGEMRFLQSSNTDEGD